MLLYFLKVKNSNLFFVVGGKTQLFFLKFYLTQQQGHHRQRDKNHRKKKVTKWNLNKIIKDHQVHFQRSQEKNSIIYFVFYFIKNKHGNQNRQAQ
jgi:hypothetical protein